MAEKLSEPVIQSLRDAFNLHNHRGYAQTLMDVVTPLRYVGCAATIDEVKSHYTGGPISFSAFLDLYHEIKLDNKQDKQCLKHTLDFLSGNDQWPQKEELLRILTTFGDKIELVHLPPLPSLREVLRIYGLRAQKQLSQNFLLQPASLNGLVKCAGSLRDAFVLEVGPGPGGLTRTILESRPRHLVVVELDRRFIPGLEELRMAAAEMGVKMDIYRQDILQFNAENIFPPEAKMDTEGWTSQFEGSKDVSKYKVGKTSEECKALVCQPGLHSRVRVLGNLPFNISTPLIIQWLHDIAERRGIWGYGRVPLVLTFQKEVAQRLVADVWDEQRSRLSIMAQAYCQVKYMKEIPGSAFLPPPKVDAAVVRFTPLAQPQIPVPFPYVEKFVRHAFQFRRKQIVRCIETLFPSDRTDLVIQLFKEAGVQPMKRPTQLTLLEFRDLCLVYERICRKNPEIFGFNYQDRHNLPMWNKRKTIQREVLGTENALTADYVVRKMYTDM